MRRPHLSPHGARAKLVTLSVSQLSSMDIIIRDAKTSDAEAISRLVTYWARRHTENPASPEAMAFLDTFTPSVTAERIGAANFSYYVAQGPTGLCGVIAIRDGSRIHHLFVQPYSHKQGVARALWEHAKARSGRSTFVVNASMPAIPVYERFGFVVVGNPQSKGGIAFVPMEYGHHSQQSVAAERRLATQAAGG